MKRARLARIQAATVFACFVIGMTPAYGEDSTVNQSNEGDGDCHINIVGAHGPVTISCEDPSFVQKVIRNVYYSANFKKTLIYPGARHLERGQSTTGKIIFSTFTALLPYHLYHQQAYAHANRRAFNNEARGYLVAGLFHPVGIALYNRHTSRWRARRDDSARQADISALFLAIIYAGNFLIGLWDDPPAAPPPLDSPESSRADMPEQRTLFSAISKPITATFTISVHW